VHFADGLEHYGDADAAMAALETFLTQEAQSRARAAGAEDLRITVQRDLREAEIEGRKMFIEATISVTAAGRPRVAHG
jgi:hypothetical protein